MEMRGRHYVLALVALLVLDFVWLTLNTKMYAALVMSVQGSAMQVRKPPAAAAYALMYVGLVALVLPTLLRDAPRTASAGQDALAALRVAGIYGLTVYGIFNATNLAIFKGYTLRASLMDTAWGTTVYTLVAWIMLRVLRSWP